MVSFSGMNTYGAVPYRITVDWVYLPGQVERYQKEYNLDMNPDFQRGHVWTLEQRIAFVEYKIRGGHSGGDIWFNHPKWNGSKDGQMVLVDGKQRLTSVLMFLNNEFPAFGHYISEFTDRPNWVNFNFNVASYKTRAELLNWYLFFNAGGTPHTPEELNRVQELLKAEKSATT